MSDWLNRLLPHLPIPCFQLEAGCSDPVDLAEQGFPPTFFTGSWSLWEFNERHRASWGKRMLRDTQAGDAGTKQRIQDQANHSQGAAWEGPCGTGYSSRGHTKNVTALSSHPC